MFRAKDWFEGHSQIMDGRMMFFVACFGVFVNLVLISVFHEEHESGIMCGKLLEMYMSIYLVC